MHAHPVALNLLGYIDGISQHGHASYSFKAVSAIKLSNLSKHNWDLPGIAFYNIPHV